MKHPGKLATLVVATAILLSAGGAAGYLLAGDAGTPDRPAPRVPVGWNLCINPDGGYSVGYPSDWYTSHLRPGAACTLFDDEPFTLDPGAGWPAVDLEVIGSGGSVAEALKTRTDARAYRIVRREETTVAGLPAVLIERVVTGGGLFENGTRIFGYVVDRDDEAFTVEAFAPPTASAADYASLKTVTETVASTLRFDA